MPVISRHRVRADRTFKENQDGDTHQLEPPVIGEAMLAASRQVWLASLGAAVVTREWAQNGSRRRVPHAGQGRHRSSNRARSASSATGSKRSITLRERAGAPRAHDASRSSTPPNAVALVRNDAADALPRLAVDARAPAQARADRRSAPPSAARAAKPLKRATQSAQRRRAATKLIRTLPFARNGRACTTGTPAAARRGVTHAGDASRSEAR